jgi:hypothetical protein
MPNQRIEALDTRSDGLKNAAPPPDGAIVPWLRSGESNRPIVRLDDGRMALVDTGSRFGLAVSQSQAIIVGNNNSTSGRLGSRDLGGGAIYSRRVLPTTVSFGGLVLRRVPTDILFGVEKDAPVILGRDALYPFRITFDPSGRLIEFAPGPKR